MIETTENTVFKCDQLATENISKADLQRECELQHSCWWEYRGMHPTQRTLLFAATYAEITQHYHAKDKDYKRAENVTGLAGVSADLGSLDRIFPTVLDSSVTGNIKLDEKTAKHLRNKKQNLTGLWRARQAADEDCISYRIYLGAVFERSSLMLTRHRYSPRPIHLYSAAARMAALDAQCKEIEAYTPDFTNPNLMVGSTAPFKAEFDEWLYELGAMKKLNKQMVFDRMVALNLITASTAAEWTTRAGGAH